MEIVVSARHMDVSEPIRDYAHKRLAKLTRYYDRVMQVEVILDKAEHSQFDVEVKVLAELGDPFLVQVRGADVYACIDEAEKKLERQLTAFKEKRRHHKHVGGHP